MKLEKPERERERERERVLGFHSSEAVHSRQGAFING